jgi:hypothetical protein
VLCRRRRIAAAPDRESRDGVPAGRASWAGRDLVGCAGRGADGRLVPCRAADFVARGARSGSDARRAAEAFDAGKAAAAGHGDVLSWQGGVSAAVACLAKPQGAGIDTPAVRGGVFAGRRDGGRSAGTGRSRARRCPAGAGFARAAPGGAALRAGASASGRARPASSSATAGCSPVATGRRPSHAARTAAGRARETSSRASVAAEPAGRCGRTAVLGRGDVKRLVAAARDLPDPSHQQEPRAESEA